MNCTTALFVFFALKRSCEKLSFYILKCESIASNFLWNPSDEGGFNLKKKKSIAEERGGGVCNHALHGIPPSTQPSAYELLAQRH